MAAMWGAEIHSSFGSKLLAALAKRINNGLHYSLTS
jgi:hypothetical protein